MFSLFLFNNIPVGCNLHTCLLQLVYLLPATCRDAPWSIRLPALDLGCLGCLGYLGDLGRLSL